MAESQEGGTMVETWMEGPGIRSPVMEPAVVETKTETIRHRARVTTQVWRAKVELS